MDTITTPMVQDTASAMAYAEMVMNQFKTTIDLMYQAMLNMEPILYKQLIVIGVQRNIANLTFIGCYILTIVLLAMTLKNVQNVQKIWHVKLGKKIWTYVSVIYLVILAVFNIVPNILLHDINKQLEVTNMSGYEQIQNKLSQNNSLNN